jgi:hypothetical protein
MHTAIAHPQNAILGALVAPFHAVAEFLTSLDRARQAAALMEEFSMMSDADLIRHGLTRDSLQKEVFRILG